VQCKHIIYEFCFHRVAAYFPFCHEFFSFLLSAASLFNAIEKKCEMKAKMQNSLT
jgi:hypothetical protein